MIKLKIDMKPTGKKNPLRGKYGMSLFILLAEKS